MTAADFLGAATVAMPKLAINLPLFAFCTELLAQQWQHNTPPGLHLNPPGFAVATFGRSAVADLTNHQLPDLVVLATEDGAGGREAALLVAAPGIHSSAVVLPNTDGKRVRDIAVIRGGDPVDGRDALALATDLGLFRWLTDGSMTRYGGIAWQNATRIDVGDFDGDGVADVIGKMGDNSTGNPQNVRCTSIGGTAGWMVDTGAPILDLAAVDWVTNPGLARDEVAVVHQNAVHFLVDGALDPNLSVELPPCASACIVPMRTASGDVRLVVGMTDAANHSALAMITPGYPLLAIRLVGRPIGGLTAVDHAGASGVLVAIADNANLIHFVHDETAFPAEGFAPGNNLRAAAEPANGAAGARLLDLDADGDLDLFSSTAGVGIQISRAPGDDPYCGDRPILIRPPQSLAMTYQLPFWADQVETLHFQFTTAWRQDLTVESIEMDPEGLSRTFAPAGTLYTSTDIPLLGNLAVGPVASAVRAVQRDADGRIVRRGPFRIYIEVYHQEERAFLESQFTAGCTANVIVAPVSTDSPLVYSGAAPGHIFAWEKPPPFAPGILPTVVEPPVLPPPKQDPPVPPKGGHEAGG